MTRSLIAITIGLALAVLAPKGDESPRLNPESGHGQGLMGEAKLTVSANQGGSHIPPLAASPTILDSILARHQVRPWKVRCCPRERVSQRLVTVVAGAAPGSYFWRWNTGELWWMLPGGCWEWNPRPELKP